MASYLHLQPPQKQSDQPRSSVSDLHSRQSHRLRYLPGSSFQHLTDQEAQNKRSSRQAEFMVHIAYDTEDQDGLYIKDPVVGRIRTDTAKNQDQFYHCFLSGLCLFRCICCRCFSRQYLCCRHFCFRYLQLPAHVFVHGFCYLLRIRSCLHNRLCT